MPINIKQCTFKVCRKIFETGLFVVVFGHLQTRNVANGLDLNIGLHPNANATAGLIPIQEPGISKHLQTLKLYPTQ